MKSIRISFAVFNQPWHNTVYCVTAETVQECYRLGRKKGFDPFDYWRRITLDNSIQGDTMIWQENTP